MWEIIGVAFWVATVFTTGEVPSCEYSLTERQGVFTTPNYPNNYSPGLSCVWLVTAPQGHYVEAAFEDFDVEPFDNCKTDVLEIKDGGDKNAPMLGILPSGPQTNFNNKYGGQYCNIRKPPIVVTSTSNQLRFWFSSDSTIHHKGFKVKYRILKEADCGGQVEAPYGEVTSPRFPLHYPNMRACEWKLQVPAGKYLSLKFLSFEVETTCPVGMPCKCLDKVYVKQKGSQKKTYCSDSPMPLVASSNEVTLGFTSDLYGRLTGFRAVFTQSSTAGCGGDIFVRNGTLETPHFAPEAQYTYPGRSNCVWTISASSHEEVSIEFLYFDVARTSTNESCPKDYVEVRKGKTKDGELIGRYCNSNKPPTTITSEHGPLFINFHSDVIEDGVSRGFQMKFQVQPEQCESGLLESATSITTSSSFTIAHQPYLLAGRFASLTQPYAWCSKEIVGDSLNEYLEIVFDKAMEVGKIVTQGYSMVGNEYFVTRYTVTFSVDRNNFMDYVTPADQAKGKSKTTFVGNTKYDIAIENDVIPAVAVRKVRLLPVDYVSGRRKHICMKVEVYGCPVWKADDRLLTHLADSVSYTGVKTTQWVISPPSEGGAVFILNTKTARGCKNARLFISANGVNDDDVNYCGDKRNTFIFSTTRQVWLIWEVMDAGDNAVPQLTFSYETQDLGKGRVIKNTHGIIDASHLQHANSTSAWLFKVQGAARIQVEFTKLRLPEQAKIVLRSGLKESSHEFRRIVGSQNLRSAFVHTGDVMRLEYHPGHTKGDKNDGFTLKYTVFSHA